MPGYKGHTVGGLAAFGLVRVLLAPLNPTLLTSFEWLLVTLFGALLPDIDIKSRGQNIYYVLLAGGYMAIVLLGKLSWSPFFVVAALFPMLLSHRGLSHRVWFAMLLSLSVGVGLSSMFPSSIQASWFNALFFGIGMLSHLVLDAWIR